MTEITFSIPEKLFQKMKKYPEIKWSSIARSAIEKYIEDLEVTDEITSKSTLSSKDAEIIGDKIKKGMWEKHKKLMTN